MLDRVGGLLGRVGEVVRSCHERWDGRGYPDGLAGEQFRRGAHRLRVRRLQRDDDRPPLPPCHARRGCGRRTPRTTAASSTRGSSPRSSRLSSRGTSAADHEHRRSPRGPRGRPLVIRAPAPPPPLASPQWRRCLSALPQACRRAIYESRPKAANRPRRRRSEPF